MFEGGSRAFIGALFFLPFRHKKTAREFREPFAYTYVDIA
jgi:hypothetical protein